MVSSAYGGKAVMGGGPVTTIHPSYLLPKLPSSQATIYNSRMQLSAPSFHINNVLCAVKNGAINFHALCITCVPSQGI